MVAKTFEKKLVRGWVLPGSWLAVLVEVKKRKVVVEGRKGRRPVCPVAVVRKK